MTNPKLEKVKAKIAKTKTIISEYQGKLKDLEKQKTQLENDEIVALYRREKLNEDEFKALLRTGRYDNDSHAPEEAQAASCEITPNERKEENSGDNA